VSQINANLIIRAINENSKTFWRPDRTLVSFGCYSDPWDYYSKHHTKRIMIFLNELGYKVTLSTKQTIKPSDLKQLDRLNRNHFFFFISLPLADEIFEREKGTSSLRDRINSLKALHNSRFNVALYIKPFFEIQTAKNIPTIIEILKSYRVPVILGRLFVDCSENIGKKAVINKRNILVESESEEYFAIKAVLQKYTTVYENSHQVFGGIGK
jgi:DNA repair photolyase